MNPCPFIDGLTPIEEVEAIYFANFNELKDGTPVASYSAGGISVTRAYPGYTKAEVMLWCQDWLRKNAPDSKVLKYGGRKKTKVRHILI